MTATGGSWPPPTTTGGPYPRQSPTSRRWTSGMAWSSLRVLSPSWRGRRSMRALRLCPCHRRHCSGRTTCGSRSGLDGYVRSNARPRLRKAGIKFCGTCSIFDSGAALLFIAFCAAAKASSHEARRPDDVVGAGYFGSSRLYPASTMFRGQAKHFALLSQQTRSGRTKWRWSITPL